VPPLADWPDDLREAVLYDARIVGGGHHYDGREIGALDMEAVRLAAEQWRGRVEAIAVTGVFSPANAEHERRAAALLAELTGVPVSVSHEIGSIGLLERENATVLNAALTGVAARAARSFEQALESVGVTASSYLSQNDGTLMTLRQAAEYPVRTVASGPTNSLRGGGLLSGRTDAVVVDVGGTTADFGALGGGFPRESGVAVDVGGVVTNFRMPDLVSIGIGGGTVVRGDGRDIRLGPDSVGHEITRRALCFGGDTVTLTDAAVVAGIDLGDRAAASARLDQSTAVAILAAAQERLAIALDRIRANAEDVTVIAVGGGSFLVPDALAGAVEVVRPPHHEVANAVGAAIAEVGGEVDRVYRMDGRSRDSVLEEARERARAQAVEAGADPGTVREIDFEEIQLAYLPGNAVRVKARAAGRLRGFGPAETAGHGDR
jgi:N-methylhydantoinase A/oxoprolinase/acetone carboxylase beta subunit